MINANEIKKITKNLSILLVEDHDIIRKNTCKILEKFFKKVVCSMDGQEALKKYKHYKETNSKYFDIVISDIKMPIMDGIELTKYIRKINLSQTIIIVSAHDDSKYLLSLINLGIEQFIKKPIDYKELITTFYNASKKIIDKNSELSSTVNISDTCTYNKQNRSLIYESKNVYLTKFEIIFLELLISDIGKVYSNEEVVKHFISLDETIDSSNIRKLVSKLRKKLPKDVLKSIYSIGYKIVPSF